jgi:hypothetical protein
MPMFRTAHRGASHGMPGNPPAGSFVAQFDFKAYYTSIGSSNVQTDTLPIPLFMPLHEASNYKGIDTPTGVSISGTSLKDVYSLTYSKTGFSDAVLAIEGLTSSWGVLQRGILSLEEYELSKVRLSVEGGLETYFFSTYMKLFGRSALGKTFMNDSVPFISQKSPLQYDKTILDLDVKLHIQKDTGIVYGMPAPTFIGTNSPITFSLFVSRLARK